MGYGYRYVYNAKRQVTTQTDANGNATSYTYDVYGNILTETKPNGSKIQRDGSRV